MSDFREIKREVCPICGHQGFCCWWDDPDGSLLICKRTGNRSDVLGLDGVLYRYRCQTKRSDFAVFEEEEQAKQKDEAYKKSKSDSSKSYTYARAVPRQKTVLDQVQILPNAWLDKIYRAMLDMMVLEDWHREYLHSEGWTDELIDSNIIRTIPPSDYIRFKYKNFKSNSPTRKEIGQKMAAKFGENGLVGVPGFYRDKKGEWTMCGPSGIFLPLYDVKRQMYWDTYEHDYYGIGYSDHILREEAGKKLKRMTKFELLEASMQCMNVYQAYVGLQNRYDGLKNAMDVLRDKNTGQLQVIREIENLYENMTSPLNQGCDWTTVFKEWSRYTNALPQEAWIA